jgi:ribosomal protein L37AE/L43A
MPEEHEAREPYKCAVCGEKFDSQERLQQHLKQCTAKKSSTGCNAKPVMTGGGTFRRPVIAEKHWMFLLPRFRQDDLCLG